MGGEVTVKLKDGVLMMSVMMSAMTKLLLDQEEVDAEVVVSVVKLHTLLLEVGGFVLLKLRLELLELSELLKFLSLQDLQHICRYPAMEQYRLNTSIRQNTERSPRQRSLEEILGAGKPVLDLDSHLIMAFFWSPPQSRPWQVRVVIGRGSLQFWAEPSVVEHAT